MGEEDIRNAAERLRKLLRSAQYPQLSNLRLEDGVVSDLLRMLHFVLLDSSRLVAQFLLERGYDLYGKTDARFVKSAFRLLRDEFQYFPTLSATQFLSQQFVARKLAIVADAATAVAKKHQELQKQKRREKTVWFQPQKTSKKYEPKARVENHALPASMTNPASRILQHLKLQQSRVPKVRRQPVKIDQVEQGFKATAMPVVTEKLENIIVQSASESASQDANDKGIAPSDRMVCSCAGFADKLATALTDLTCQVNDMSKSLMDKVSSVETRLGRLEDQMHGVQATVNEQHKLIQELSVHYNRWGDNVKSQVDDQEFKSEDSTIARKLGVESPCVWPPQPSVFERY